MKLIGIGDLFIPCSYIKSGFQALEKDGVEIDTIEWQFDSFDELQKANLLVEQSGCEALEPPVAILEQAKSADILVTHFCPITRNVIDQCPNLKIIGVLRGGYENVNVTYAQSKGIQVMHTPGRNADSVADYTVGMAIAECRNIAKGHYGIKNGEWIREYPNMDTIPDLPGRTFGLVGLGEIGKKVVKRLSGFDMHILVYDPFVKPEQVESLPIELVTLEQLLKESDFVSLHARLTDENTHMIGKAQFALMKETAYFINTARAGLVDEEALYEALRDHQIAGAAIDVFEVEPPGLDHPLVKLENITLTPHMAGGSRDAFFNTPKMLAVELEKVLAKQPSRYLLKETHH